MTLSKVKKRCGFICSCSFLLLSFTANAQNPQLTASVDKDSIIIGEPLRYLVQATFPTNTYNLSWLDIPDSTAHFEVIERQKSDTIQSNGIVKVQQVIMLTSFDSGVRTIPSFAVKFTPQNNGTPVSVFTDSIRVKVSFSPMDSAKSFHDIKPIIAVTDERSLWVWIAIGLGLILLALLAYYLVKRFGRKKSPGLFTSKLSPLEEAIQSLSQLQKEQLLIKQQVKQFHITLGGIFKRYISRTTNANLLNLTSGEVLIKLNEMNIRKEDVALVANNLRMADAVKFAKYIPPDNDSERAFFDTRKIIEQIDQSITKSKSGI